jgi:hypothetical protein
MEDRPIPDFNKSIIELQTVRQQAERYSQSDSPGGLQHESELCYQLISLYMGLDKYYHKSGIASHEYVDEKQNMIVRVVKAMIHDRVLKLEGKDL